MHLSGRRLLLLRAQENRIREPGGTRPVPGAVAARMPADLINIAVDGIAVDGAVLFRTARLENAGPAFENRRGRFRPNDLTALVELARFRLKRDAADERVDRRRETLLS